MMRQKYIYRGINRLAKVESICNIDWSTLNKAKTQAIKQVANLPETKEFTNQLLPEISSETILQLEADILDRIKIVTPNADIPEQARA